MDATGPGSLRVRLLGGFEVEGIPERAIGTRKARQLLRRLAVAEGGPVAVEELVEAVWGEDPPSRPANQLSVLVSRLRGVVGAERVRRSDAGYAFEADWFDTAVLADRVRECEARWQSGQAASAQAAARAALGLCRGVLLPEEDAAWVDERRTELDRLVARARRVAAETSLRLGDGPGARDVALAMLDADPYDEEALRTAMRAEVASGRSGAALSLYADVRRRLVEELGADPDDQTEALHMAILTGEVQAEAASSAPGLVGRLSELRVLDEALSAANGGGGGGVVVEGEAGMGKSALVSAWVHSVGDRAVVLSGRCDELGRDLPLQPVFDALAAHVGRLGRAAGGLLGDEAEILDPFLGRGAPRTPAAATTVRDHDASRTVLFGALGAVFGRVAEQQPVVLTVDDLHMATPMTCSFLEFLMHRVARVTVIAARRPQAGGDLPGARRLRLGPLMVEDAVALVGERGAALHQRAGGNPLFLLELARSPADAVPASVVAAVSSRLDAAGVGDALRAAAVLGSTVDVDLLRDVTGGDTGATLDELEAATNAGLLMARGSSLRFAHELVREAVAASVSSPRRTAIHRAAVEALSGRPGADPMALADHARGCGDTVVASRALIAAASESVQRFEIEVAHGLLDEAIGLHDSADARLARGRLAMSGLDLDAAGADADAAVSLGAGGAGLELAGWAAYYGRDYPTARRCAEEGAARAGNDDAIRASCMALSGRILHTAGELDAASDRLSTAVDVAPAGVRGVAQVWFGQLLLHRGSLDDAAEQARRGLLDPHLGHPFAPMHGRFTLAVALGQAGRWSQARAVLDELADYAATVGDKRFPAVIKNVEGWLLRGVGAVDSATDVHRENASTALGESLGEARYVAYLDLADDRFAADDADGAAEAADACADILEWHGSMWWRQHTRYRLLRARLASLGGDHQLASDQALEVAATSVERGDRRYAARARLFAAVADARAGRAPSSPVALADALGPVAGVDGWRDLAELAAATRSEKVWHAAEDLAAAVVADASSSGRAGTVVDSVRRQLDRWQW